MFRYKSCNARKKASKRGHTSRYEYDFAGRVRQATRKDGSEVDIIVSDIQGLVDTSQGSGIASNPAPEPPIIDDINTRHRDGRGNTTTTQLNAFGQVMQQTDEIGREYT